MPQGSTAFASEFHRQYFHRSRWMIALGFVFVGLNYFVSDFYALIWLELPPDIPMGVRWAERGLIMPVCLITALILYRYGDRAWTQWAVIIGGVMVGTGIVLGRRIWQQHDVPFFSDYSMYFLCSMAAVSAMGPRIWLLVGPPMLLNLLSGYYVFGYTPAAHFEAIGVAAAALVVAAINWQLGRVMQPIWEEREHFAGLSRTDPLTGLINRRAFESSATTLIAQSRHNSSPLSVAMLDIDYFKAFNDHYGHPAGDEALVQLAKALRSQARRPLDLCARLGGEEFALVWHNVDEQQTEHLCEHLLAAIRSLGIPHQAQPDGGTLTASLGVCHLRSANTQTLQTLMAEADRALYLAKHSGRNRYVQVQAE